MGRVWMMRPGCPIGRKTMKRKTLNHLMLAGSAMILAAGVSTLYAPEAAKAGSRDAAGDSVADDH